MGFRGLPRHELPTSCPRAAHELPTSCLACCGAARGPQMHEAAASSRGLSREDFGRALSGAPLLPAAAEQAGLVDGARYK